MIIIISPAGFTSRLRNVIKKEEQFQSAPPFEYLTKFVRIYFFFAGVFFAILSLMAARAAASFATVTRYGEQLT
jgi:hypothetical protein